MGASSLIIDGSISVKRGGIERFTQTGLVLDNGEEIAANRVVLATGFRPMSELVANIAGQNVADKVGKIWGIGSGFGEDVGPWTGETSNMWVPTPQEGLWLHGGNLQQARFYSKFLALQLKARHAGIATNVFPSQTC